MNNRFDIYLHVHKGLRAFMVDVLTNVGRINAADPIEVAAAVAQVRSLLEICRAHLFPKISLYTARWRHGGVDPRVPQQLNMFSTKKLSNNLKPGFVQ